MKETTPPLWFCCEMIWLAGGGRWSVGTAYKLSIHPLRSHPESRPRGVSAGCLALSWASVEHFPQTLMLSDLAMPSFGLCYPLP